MSKKVSQIPEKKLKLYKQLIDAIPDVELKGATVPYTSRNGRMFSFLYGEGKMALRLPEKERGAFLKQYKTKLCKQYGTVMKEYVEVPDSLLRRKSELNKFFEVSYSYVGALKPKPSRKK